MKFKSLTKLALSGVALGAVAATLGTSTYAWYVVNGTATATGITIDTQAAGGSVYLSNTGGKGSFTGSVALNTASGGNLTIPSTLTPVTPVNVVETTVNPVKAQQSTAANVTGFATKNGNVVEDDTTVLISGHVFVKSDSAQNVLLGMKVVNDGAESTQNAINTTGTPVSAANTAFSSDIVKALRFAYVRSEATEGESAATVATATQLTTANIYAADVIDTTYASPNWVDVTNSNDANTYYASVMGEDPYGCELDSQTWKSVADPAGTVSAEAFTAAQVFRYDFYVWLEGTDSYCFDSCAGQGFTMTLTFTGSNA